MTITDLVSPFEWAARAFEQRYLYDPVLFAQEVIDWPDDTSLTNYQEEILGELPRRRRVAVRGPHGLGKSGLAAIAVLWFSTTRDQAGIDWKVLTTASAWRHLSVYLWPEIHKWARRIRWERLGRTEFNPRTEMLALMLKLQYGAATAVASSKAELIEGAHADSLLYLLDEAKIIPPATWDAIEGAFSGGRDTGLPEAFALAVSTPGAPAGRFYEIHKRSRGLDEWWVRHVTLAEAIRAGRISQKWADQRALQWGKDSAMYANRVLGDFHADDETSTIPLAWVEAAVERWHTWVEAGRPELPGGGRPVKAVDVARGGSDATVIAHRFGVCVDHLDRHHGEDTMATTARVLAALGADPVATRSLAVVDSIGVGGGVVDRLRELRMPVLPYTGSAKTNARDRTGEFGFANVRSAAYWHMRELLDPAFGAAILLPPDELLLADLNAPTWAIKTGVPPKIAVENKDDLVGRLGRSPDDGDAVVMAFWADALRREAHVATPTPATMPVTNASPLGRGSLGGRSGLGPLG